ncbi:MAG TPA: serine hydrolase domain-containing protein [Thermoanaerobaculia bacterium]|nr:serine hydrolase domain-containing protein [Thermoanaerobaculia bacterium]
MKEAEKIDALFAPLDRPDSPGCAVAVLRDGDVVLQRCHGMADLERGIAITPSTVFDVASTSKQFTAVCIALLAEQGKLGLDDEARAYLPELPRYEAPLTIRHLLQHTGGVRDYPALLGLAGLPDVTPAGALALIARQKGLDFTPGEEFLYCNSGYVLLAEIVERVSGQPLARFAEENVFRPLGMGRTAFSAEPVAGQALAYSPGEEGGFQIDMEGVNLPGDGALKTTLEDLCRWDRNFYDNRLGRGGPGLIEQLVTPGVLASGEPIGYGLGLFLGEFAGLRFVRHSGTWAGYKAELLRFPDLRLSVILLSNLGALDPEAVSRQIAEALLAEHLPPQPEAEPAEVTEEPPFIDLPEAELEAKTGTFRNRATGRMWQFSRHEGKLVAVSGLFFEIRPVSRTHFRAVGAPAAIDLYYQEGPAGRPAAIGWHVAGQEPGVLEPLELAIPTAEELAGYAGRYHSEELAATHEVVAAEGGLALRLGAAPFAAPLEATAKDQFTLQGAVLDFLRDGAGRVSGFAVSLGRIKGLRFEKTATA